MPEKLNISVTVWPDDDFDAGQFGQGTYEIKGASTTGVIDSVNANVSALIDRVLGGNEG